MNNIIEQALAYTSLGFSVIPLGKITKDANGKKVIPYLIPWKEFQTRIATEAEIKKWKCESIGIVTGPISNLLVLDADAYKKTYDRGLFQSFNLPITPVQATASGGKQYFFKYPKGVTIKNDVCIGSRDSGIDIRAEGGMVIVPPTETDYGAYTWEISLWDEPLAEVPPKLLEMLIKPQHEDERKRTTLPELIDLKEGEGRNNAMASFVGKMLKVTPPDRWDSEVLSMAVSVNRTYMPPMSDAELLSVYKSIVKIENTRITEGIHTQTDSQPYNLSISHAELITKEFPATRYIVEPFFESGAMNMLSAPPNTWKSWLLFLFAKHIATGTLVFGKFQTEKVNVMIVNEEDSPRSIQDRLKLLNIREHSLPIYYRIAQGSKLSDDFIGHLIEEAKEKTVGIIFFDSLRAIHEAEENSSTEMQKVMDQLKRITREGIAVVFTHHNRKTSPQSRNNDAESSRGSTAINAAISGHLSLTELEDKKEKKKYLTIKHLKSKAGEKLQPFDIEIITGESVDFVYLGEHKAKERMENEVKEKILSELQGREEWLTRKDFKNLRIAGETTIKNVLKSLEENGEIQSMTRKEAEKRGVKTLMAGKSNEVLYFINEQEDLLDQQPSDEF